MKNNTGKFLSFHIGILTICFFVVASYGQAVAELKEDVSEVRLEVKAPFSTATITIDGQGQIDYIASSPDTGIYRLTDSGSIALDQYRELIDLINDNNYFALEDKYIEEKLADATSYIITVKKGYQTKSVVCYGTCPDQIWTIINKIKELWGKEILEVGG